MEQIKIETLLDYSSLGSLVLSKDNHYAAFSMTKALANGEGYSSSIWSIDLTNKSINKLAGNTGSTVFFLDNTSVCYTAVRNEVDKTSIKKGALLTVFQVYSLASHTEMELFRVPLHNAFAWNLSDGEFLIKSYFENKHPDFENMDSSISKETKTQYDLDKDYIVCEELPFCNDGKYYTNRKRNRLFLYNIHHKGLTPITDPNFDTSQVCILPKEHKIFFSGASFTKLAPRCHGIYMYDVNSNTISEIIAPGQFQIMALAASNTNELMAAAAPWDGIGPFPNHNIYMIDIKARSIKLCNKHSDVDYGLKTCSDTRLGPGSIFCIDLNDLWYIITRNNSSILVKYSIKEGMKYITNKENNIDYFACNKNLVLCIACKGDSLQEVYEINLHDGCLHCLTHFNDKISDNFYISSPQQLSYVNKDNIRIDGFVIPPVNYTPGKKYPGILEIHGGPRASYSKAFNHEMQVLASCGYFVFFCNPRGSSGRGEAFAETRGMRGTIDYSDLMEFCNQVLSHYPDIDCKHLGVAGGSHGGFMVNWIIGHTKRFAAAVSMRSISNHLSNFGTADFSMWGNRGSLMGDPWNDTEKLWNLSPLKYAINVTTPTLFIHSLNDMRCTISNAQQMYSILMWNGVETKMFIFKDECHELSRSGKPRHRIKRLYELVNWMDLHLKK